jgi:hypothetical protein
MTDFLENIIIDGRAKSGAWNNFENHKIYAEWLGKKLGYKKYEDWYNLTAPLIQNNYGSGILSKYYKNSSILFLKSIYPEYDWLEWLFTKTTNNFWKNKENRKKYAEWLSKILEIKETHNWYSITKDTIKNNYGASLNISSIKDLLKEIFPEEEWLEWKFTNTSKRFWKNFENHKKYAEWLGKKLNYKKPEDWYKLTRKDFIDNDGGTLLSSYNGSPIQFLRKIFPNEEWLEWKFGMAPLGFWKKSENRKKYMIWLSKILEIKETHNWYSITKDTIKNNYGASLNISSIKDLLKEIYPDYEWLEWKFVNTSLGFWQDIENHKKYSEWLGNKLKYNKPEDWYKLTRKDFIDNDGGTLLSSYYNGSPIQFLRKIFPNEEWLEWKFGMSSMGTWQNIENHKKYADWLFKELDYKNMEDWYKITQNDIHNKCGSGLLQSYYNSSPVLFLKTIYSNYKWDMSNFKKQYSKGQIEWLNYLLISTPDLVHILNNNNGEYKIPNSRYSADGYSQLKNTIFEYHGDYFHGNPKFYNPTEINKRCKVTYGELYENTLKKQQFCIDNGYKYCFIWESDWNKAKFGLIKFQKIIKNKLSLV